MIPKIIHYCWLSDEPFPKKQQDCIASWKKYCPDYQIIKWDTNKFDITSHPLVKQAFENKKWAFAADYIRAYAVYTFGGLYLDSDVMLYNRIDDVLDAEFVSGVEYHPKNKDRIKNIGKLDSEGKRISNDIVVSSIGIQAAFIAAQKGHPLLKKCLEFYDRYSLNDILNNGYIAPNVLAYNAEEYGFCYVNKEQKLLEGIHLYPTNIISHFDQYSSNSIAVHFCSGSWVSKNFLQRCLHYIKSKKYLYLIYIYLKQKKII